MPRFNYSALSDSGATTRGTVEADTQAAAIRILGERRLFPVTIEGDPSDPAVKPRRRIKAADSNLLAVSEEDGRFLRFLIVSNGTKRALEIGGAGAIRAADRDRRGR